MRNDGFLWFFWILLAVVGLLGALYYGARLSACDARGGTLVRGGIGYVCVRPVR